MVVVFAFAFGFCCFEIDFRITRRPTLLMNIKACALCVYRVNYSKLKAKQYTIQNISAGIGKRIFNGIIELSRVKSGFGWFSFQIAS